uniref:Ig-like domain-containing protein n=1 Tax=Pygocentrus nattereri TaxID=42514 RepID=A0A3B4DZX3_PYGNA
GMTARFQFNFFNIFLFPGDTSAQTVVPLEGEIHSIAPLENKTHIYALEDETVNLSCTYDGDVRTLFWYHQYPGSRPENLLLIVPGSKDESHERLKAKVDVKENRVDLLISSAEISDSALYYCALQPTVTGNPATLYKKCFMQSSVLVRRGSLLLAIGPYSFPKHYICTPSQKLINGSWSSIGITLNNNGVHSRVARRKPLPSKKILPICS